MWVIGWREWVTLPGLGITRIKAKLDTGARSSALHAFGVEVFRRDRKQMVRFVVHPFQRSSTDRVHAEAELLDMRMVRSSSGEVETRPVILTPVRLLEREWMIDLTLTNRDEMGFRMLLGRQALRGRFLIDAGRSFLAGDADTARKPVRRRSL